MGQYWDDNPPVGKRGTFRDQSWTTIVGWEWNSKRMAHALIRNGVARGGYKYGITINAPKSSNLESFQKDWRAICDQFRRKKITAHFQLEITKRDRWHAHGVSLNEEKELRRIWSEVKPNGWTLRITRKLVSWRKWCRYIVKTKEYWGKRCIRKANLGIDKHTTINRKGFWAKTVDDYWQEVIDREKRISEWENEPNYWFVVEKINQALDISKKQLRYLVDPESAAYQTWI